MTGLALALWVGLTPVATAAQGNLTVVELFTSQGCSMCPPADAFLGELAGRDDVLALSFHVDYWDYIGWKDPFADPAHTRRQRDYAERFGRGYVYTPQMVVQGAAEDTGSNRAAILRMIADSKAGEAVPLRLHRGPGGAVRVAVAARPAAADGELWAVLFDREKVTDVKRGENQGRRLRHSNVVRRLHRVGTWSGAAVEYPLDIPDMASDGADVCAVILQSTETGRVLGAARLDLRPPN